MAELEVVSDPPLPATIFFNVTAGSVNVNLDATGAVVVVLAAVVVVVLGALAEATALLVVARSCAAVDVLVDVVAALLAAAALAAAPFDMLAGLLCDWFTGIAPVRAMLMMAPRDALKR